MSIDYPRAPSAIDQRRLRDGSTALVVSDRMGETIDLVRAQLEAVGVGIAALQSLDDLGSEANERAERDQQELWKRMKALEQRLKDLEGKAAKP
jgi:ABC-type phosphate transport system auxiliary subunit